MKLKEIAAEVSFAHEVNEDPTLNTMIQRSLDETRAKGRYSSLFIKKRR